MTNVNQFKQENQQPNVSCVCIQKMCSTASNDNHLIRMEKGSYIMWRA